jgi:hypothetical protein
MVHTTPFKLVALLLAAVLMVVAGTPARADAMDALTIIAIASLAVAGIVLIAYLVVANVEGDKQASSEGRVVWMACAAGDGCASIPAETATALIEPVEPVVATADRQGP